jgi:hypothetical protein
MSWNLESVDEFDPEEPHSAFFTELEELVQKHGYKAAAVCVFSEEYFHLAAMGEGRWYARARAVLARFIALLGEDTKAGHG